MIKKVWTSDIAIIAGLAIVLFSAKFGAGALPRVSEWVSGLLDSRSDSDAAESQSQDAAEQTTLPIVIETQEPTTPSAPIIVLPSSKQQPPRCPAHERQG